MNWAAVAAIASLIGVLVTIVVGAYNSGQVTQKLDNNIADTRAHAERLDDHGERIGGLDVKVGKLEEWKEGYNAASRVSVSRDPNPIL